MAARGSVKKWRVLLLIRHLTAIVGHHERHLAMASPPLFIPSPRRGRASDDYLSSGHISISDTINGACLTAHERSCRFRDMKKRAPAKKQSAARKPAAKKKPVSKPGTNSAAKTPAPRPAAAPTSTRAQPSSQGARYTPAALKTDGAPAFRYPPQ